MFREKKGLEFFLNVSRVAARLMSVGRVFHRRGAAELKALSPALSLYLSKLSFCCNEVLRLEGTFYL